MTFEEFLERCREKDGWRLTPSYGRIRNEKGLCPLQAVFRRRWHNDYMAAAEAAGLNAEAIVTAADEAEILTEYRKALLLLVKHE